MSYNASFIVQGQRHRYPMMPTEAEEFGWHLGVRFISALVVNDETTYTKIKTWCRETFEPHTYAVFLTSVWFLYEHDAMLCKLRWS